MTGNAKNAGSQNRASSSSKTRLKLTDAEQSKRFIEAARLSGASEDPKDFDKAFTSLALKKQTATLSHGGKRPKRF